MHISVASICHPSVILSVFQAKLLIDTVACMHTDAVNQISATVTLLLKDLPNSAAISRDILSRSRQPTMWIHLRSNYSWIISRIFMCNQPSKLVQTQETHKEEGEKTRQRQPASQVGKRSKESSFLEDGYMSSIISGLKRKTNTTNNSAPTCNVEGSSIYPCQDQRIYNGPPMINAIKNISTIKRSTQRVSMTSKLPSKAQPGLLLGFPGDSIRK